MERPCTLHPTETGLGISEGGASGQVPVASGQPTPRHGKKNSIRQEMAFHLIVATTMILVAVGATMCFVSIRLGAAELNLRAIEYAERLAGVLTGPLWLVDHSLVQQISEAYIVNREITSIRVWDNTGKEICRLGHREDTDVRAPRLAITHDGHPVGHLELSLSVRPLEEKTRHTLLITSLILVLLIVAILVVTQVSLKRYLSVPLREMTQGLERIAGGDYLHLLPVYAQEELADIGRQANSMAGQIAARDQQLHALINSLEVRIAERTTDLNLAKERAEVASRAKSEFLSTMSHELRTPLNAILGYAQILERDEHLGAKQQNSIRIVRQSGEHLLNLITDILDLAKIEARKLDLIPSDFHFDELLQSVSAIIKIRTEQKGLLFSLDTEDPLPNAVVADAKRLRQVLINLLGNAVKFTEQGEVRLRVCAPNYATDQRVRFEIRDSGIGMNPEQMAQIFKPFEQVGDKHKRSEGTGLGLSITKRLVELMGGSIDAQSEPGVGSTFTVSIPLPGGHAAPISANPAQDISICGYQGRRRHILVVDDNANNRSMLRYGLELLGFIVREAVNGTEGIAMAQEHRPDLILLDMMMPVMNGFEATRLLRSKPDFQTTPIIAVSASVCDDDQQQVLADGCQAFLGKPIDFHLLCEALQHLLCLDWVRRPGASTGVTCSDQSIRAAFPDSEIAAICQMAADGRMPPVSNRLAQILVSHPDAAPFIHRLLDAVRQFDGDQIVAMLTPYRDALFKKDIEA